MATRAKFKVTQIAATEHMRQNPDTQVYERVEMRTIKLAPVYSPNPDDENRAFWNASPQGAIELGTINQGAWEQFALGDEFYIDFTKADQGGA